MNTDILVPITFFVVVLLAIKLLLAYRTHRRRELHQTLRAALENGEDVPRSLLARLAVAVDPQRADLRKSLVLGVLTLVVAALSWFMPIEDNRIREGMLVAALLPATLALTYLAFWKFGYRGADDSIDRN